MQVTPLGRQLAAFPLAPRFAKMLVLGHQGGCLPYAVGMVAALSVENPIVYDRADATAEDSESDEPHENVQQEEDEKMEAAREQECAAKINNKNKGGGRGGEGGGEEGEEELRAKSSGRMAGLKCRRDLWWHAEGDVLSLVKAFGAYAFRYAATYVSCIYADIYLSIYIDR